MSERIAVFGDRESVYGYAALGLDVFCFDVAEDYTARFKKLCQNKNYSIIFITEAAAAALEKEIRHYSDTRGLGQYRRGSLSCQKICRKSSRQRYIQRIVISWQLLSGS